MNTKQKRPAAVTAKHHLKHTFVPHKANQYRPHLIKWQGLTVVIVLALVLQFVYGFIATGNFVAFARASNIDTAELLAETNRMRDIEGAQPLTVNPLLNDAAQLKMQDMFANNYWAHVSPSGVEPWKWLNDVGYSYRQAGENLAKNYPDADATVSAWMASPTHRANMLDKSYTEVGFAVADGELDGQMNTVVVAYYGVPADLAALGQANSSGGSPNTVYATAVGIAKTPFDFIGAAFESLNLASWVGLVLLTVVGAVALIAHAYRRRLPLKTRRYWQRNEGVYIFVGVVTIAVIMLLLTGSGQL